MPQDPFRARVGGDVPVADGQTEQGIADAAAHQIATVSGRPQRAQERERVGVGGEGRTFRVRGHLQRLSVR